MLHVRPANCSIITLTCVKIYLLTILHILIGLIRRWCSQRATRPSKAQHLDTGTCKPTGHANCSDGDGFACHIFYAATPSSRHCCHSGGMERRTKAAALSIAIGSVKRLSRRHRHSHRQQRLHRKFSADQLCSSFSCIAPQRRTSLCNRVYVFIDKIDINRTFKAICCKIFIACKLPTASRCLSSIRFFDANLHTCHIRTFSIILYALQTHA